MDGVENYRNVPKQQRAQNAVDHILEAAAQVLESNGETGFNTNAVADRAGVSVGTLYRYFPNKRAILRALAQKEREAHLRAVADALRETNSGVARDRALIRAFIRAFAGRNRARRIAVTALLADTDHRELAAGFSIVEADTMDAQGRSLSPIQKFVLYRAVHGAMRAAVLESADFLESKEFEDELVRLGRAYLGHSP